MSDPVNGKLGLSDFAIRYGYNEHDLIGLANKLPDGVWIAGGAVRDFISGSPIRSDVDYFFRDEATLLSFIPPDAKKFKHHYSWYEGELKHQAIRVAYYANMDEILDSFDFTICMAATDGESLITGPYTLFDIARKRLQVHKITYASASVRRCFKYMSYGFTACDGCIVELLRQVTPDTLNTEVMYVD